MKLIFPSAGSFLAMSCHWTCREWERSCQNRDQEMWLFGSILPMSPILFGIKVKILTMDFKTLEEVTSRCLSVFISCYSPPCFLCHPHALLAFPAEHLACWHVGFTWAVHYGPVHPHGSLHVFESLLKFIFVSFSIRTILAALLNILMTLPPTHS